MNALTTSLPLPVGYSIHIDYDLANARRPAARIVHLFGDIRLKISNGRFEIGVSDWAQAKKNISAIFIKYDCAWMIPHIVVEAQPECEHRVKEVEDILIAHYASPLREQDLVFACAAQAVINMPRMENEPYFSSLAGMGFGFPILCIASGPSSTDYFQSIAELQSRYIIIVTASMWKAVRAHGIDPHFVACGDSSPQMRDLLPPDQTSRAILVVTQSVHPSVISGWNCLWCSNEMELASDLKGQQGLPLSTRGSGCMGIALGVHLGGDVYLIGHDLAYSGDSSHSTTADPLSRHSHAIDRNYYASFDETTVGHGGVELRTCIGWNEVKCAIERIASAHPHRIFCIGYSGAEILGVDRVSSLPNAQSDNQFDIGFNRLPKIDDLNRVGLKKLLTSDLEAFRKHFSRKDVRAKSINDTWLDMPKWCSERGAEFVGLFLISYLKAYRLRASLIGNEEVSKFILVDYVDLQLQKIIKEIA